MAITPVQQICPSSKWGIKCPYTMVPEFIVVHNTANSAPAVNEITYMNNNDSTTSFHFAVDDKEVRQGIPLDRNAFHAGDGATGAGNRKGIAIEICYSLSGGAQFDKAEALAAKFIAQLLDERGWGLDKVKKHQDFNGKYCPHRTLDYGWDRFKGMVQTELNAIKAAKNPPVVWANQEKKTYVVVTNTNLKNVKTGENVRTFTVGNMLDFVQHCTYNGKAYYRTEWSRDNNIDNGIPVLDVAEVEPETEKVVWDKLDKALTMVALRDCKLVDVKTGETKKTYALGEVITDLVDSTVIGGVTYLRPLTYREQKHSYGIDLDQLTEYDAPKDAKPEETVPDGDMEPLYDTPIDGDTYPNWFVSFVAAIIDFIKGLFTKKG